jgi:hypothetical protein
MLSNQSRQPAALTLNFMVGPDLWDTAMLAFGKGLRSILSLK